MDVLCEGDAALHPGNKTRHVVCSFTGLEPGCQRLDKKMMNAVVFTGGSRLRAEFEFNVT